MYKYSRNTRTCVLTVSEALYVITFTKYAPDRRLSPLRLKFIMQYQVTDG